MVDRGGSMPFPDSPGSDTRHARLVFPTKPNSRTSTEGIVKIDITGLTSGNAGFYNPETWTFSLKTSDLSFGGGFVPRTGDRR
jgi:hypothetical protein